MIDPGGGASGIFTADFRGRTSAGTKSEEDIDSKDTMRYNKIDIMCGYQL